MWGDSAGRYAGPLAIVREHERGTLEQLMVTPVSRLAITLGKILPDRRDHAA